MYTTGLCPGPAELRGLLDEILSPEAEASLAAHLEACGRCRHALESLAGGTVELPSYEWSTATSRFESGNHMKLAPGDVLVVDSIYAAHPLIRAAAGGRPALNVFIYAPSTVRLMRRLRRARVEAAERIRKRMKLSFCRSVKKTNKESARGTGSGGSDGRESRAMDSLDSAGAAGSVFR